MLLISISIIKRKPQNVNHKIRSDGIFCTILPDANAPLAGAGRCRRGFSGSGAGLVGAGRCLQAWGSFHGHGAPLAGVGCCRRGFPGAGRGCRSWGRRLRAWGAVGAAFLVRGRRWWAQVAVCTAFPAQGAYCERWALSARLSGSGAGLSIVGSPFVRLSRRRVPIVNAGRCRCGFPGTGTSLADVGCCLRAWGAVGAAFFGAWSPLVGAGRRLRA